MRDYFKSKSASTKRQYDSLVGRRGRLVLKTGTWSLIAKICGAINLFICVPFVLNSLGEQHFGAWATIVSMITLSAFLDFGLGNGAMNLIASAQGRSAHNEISCIVHSTYKSILKITLLLCLSLSVIPFIPWYKILGLNEIDASISSLSIAIALFSILLSIPLSIANKIQLGLGHGNKTYKWIAIGQLLTAIVVVTLAKPGAKLPLLVAASTLVPLIGLLLNTIELNKSIRPSKGLLNENTAFSKTIRKEGLLFFILQLSAALAFNFDLLLISSFVGAKEAGEYSIIQKIFSTIPMVLGLIWVSLWPTYREALAKGDIHWVFKIFRKSLIFASCFALIFGITLAFTFDFISQLWLGNVLHISIAMVLGFVFWHFIESLGTGISTFLNSASIIKYQVFLSIGFAIPCLTIKIILIRQLGVEIIPWATAICYLSLTLIPLVILRKKIFNLIRTKTY